MKQFCYQSTFYMKPDEWGFGTAAADDGKGHGPTASFDHLLEQIDMLRGSGMLLPITVKMHAGNYCLEKPITLRANHSNITFEPYGDGDVLISGGRRIAGFEKTEFMGAACVGAQIPAVKDGTWSFTDLYVGGLRAERTRLPSQGYFRMKETENPTNALFGPSKWFVAEDADLAQFSSLYAFEDAFVSFNHFWIDEHTPIERLDAETGRVYMTYRTRFNIRAGQEYILENVAEQFKNPGEWYLDRAAGMLYYIPPNEAEWENLPEIWAPVSSKLVVVSGRPDHVASGIHFRNITFAYTRGDYGSLGDTSGRGEGEMFGSDAQAVSNAHGSIEVSYANNVTFEHCTLRNFGVHGFNIKEGCCGVRVERCTVYDGGAGGVRINGGAYGAPEHALTAHCAVTDTSITHVGRRYFAACGVLMMNAASCDILHNEIGDLYYTGVSVGWERGYAKTVCHDNRIQNNHIYDLGKGFLSDMGGVYLLGSQRGTIVSGNRIHDIKCKEYGGWALYTDEGSTGILLENNLCYRTSSNSYHQHYGSNNVVRNNIFADSKDPMLAVSRVETHLSILFINNILYSTGSQIANDSLMNGAVNNGSVWCERNLLWSKNGKVTYSGADYFATLEDAQAAGMEVESIESDPLFADPDNDDYTLSPDSPALALGFVPYDWSSCGPRT